MAALGSNAASEPLPEAVSTHSNRPVCSAGNTRLSPSEIESLRQEAKRASAWMKAELARQAETKPPAGVAQPPASTPSDDAAAGP